MFVRIFYPEIMYRILFQLKQSRPCRGGNFVYWPSTRDQTTFSFSQNFRWIFHLGASYSGRYSMETQFSTWQRLPSGQIFKISSILQFSLWLLLQRKFSFWTNYYGQRSQFRECLDPRQEMGTRGYWILSGIVARRCWIDPCIFVRGYWIHLDLATGYWIDAGSYCCQKIMNSSWYC